jgi:hypothetical protein
LLDLLLFVGLAILVWLTGDGFGPVVKDMIRGTRHDDAPLIARVYAIRSQVSMPSEVISEKFGNLRRN